MAAASRSAAIGPSCYPARRKRFTTVAYLYLVFPAAAFRPVRALPAATARGRPWFVPADPAASLADGGSLVPTLPGSWYTDPGRVRPRAAGGLRPAVTVCRPVGRHPRRGSVPRGPGQLGERADRPAVRRRAARVPERGPSPRGPAVPGGRGTGVTLPALPYHAWSYELSGRLAAAPNRRLGGGRVGLGGAVRPGEPAGLRRLRADPAVDELTRLRRRRRAGAERASHCRVPPLGPGGGRGLTRAGPGLTRAGPGAGPGAAVTSQAGPRPVAARWRERRRPPTWSPPCRPASR
jgi:hypothetical protein